MKPRVIEVENWRTRDTKNPGVFHVDLFMCIIGVYLHMDFK